jgi:iduronate 2-sulfatase
LTSLRPQSLGIYDLPTHFRKAKPDAITLPQWFKQQGYFTQGLGKIFHVGHGNIDDEQSWSIPSWRPKAPTYVEPFERDPNRNKDGKPSSPATEAGNASDDTYADGAVALEAIERLKRAKDKPNDPFFLAVGFIRPHLPFVAPKKYWELYDPSKIELEPFQETPVDAPKYAPHTGSELRTYLGVPEKGSVPTDIQRHLIHGYLAATSYMDAQLGLVLDELDRLDLRKNTIVVLWGDHGWHLGDHSIWCKHSNYEQATRIPLLVSAPGMQKNAKAQSLVESVDVFPTLCELAGLSTPMGLEGKSFASVLKDSSQSTKDHILHVYPRSSPGVGQVLGRAVRTQRYRMVEWKKIGAEANSAEIELYDYQADPRETKNIAKDHEDVVAQHRRILSGYPEAKPQWTLNVASGSDANGPAIGNSNPKQDRAAMFEKRDTDKNGMLTPQEFLSGQPDPDEAPKRFSRFDVNRDGKLSKEEFVTSGKLR